MSTYEEQYPPESGPFRIGDHLIRETMDRTDPGFVVPLDFGAFRRVWEIVEEAAKTHYPTHEALSTARAELRAVEAFRKAWLGFAGSPINATSREVDRPAEGAPKRQFRRKTEPPAEPEMSKRQFKRKTVAG